MIGAALAALRASPVARRILRWGAVALAVVLFMLSLRRSGEKAGRAAERIETMEATHAAKDRMLEAAARRPADRDALAGRLRDGRF